MLPTHGTVTSVFLLANSARHRRYPVVAPWVEAAGTRSAFLSAALDHRSVAEFLLEAKLVFSMPELTLSPKLKALSRQADRQTLIAIASLLLETAPPPWLRAAVDGGVREEFIPSADLQGLAWLRPELEQLLLDAANRQASRSDSVALGLGLAAELVVLSALHSLNAAPVHVSQISDSFGYDIQSTKGPARRWEVKGATIKTSGSFHLSRNEFDVCRRYRSEWRLVQVEFAPAVVTAEFITKSHISAIRELQAQELVELVPQDTDTFYWEASARISPPTNKWTVSALAAADDIRLPSINVLGERALETRSGRQGPSFG